MMTEKYTKDKNGVFVFHNDIDVNHEDYNALGLENLYKAEERHFWFLARKEFIFQQMVKAVPYSAQMIEIGAGTGNVARFLMHQGYHDISVGEMHSNGLVHAQSYGIENCYQFDLLRAPFEDEFDAICLFDVLEHIEEDSLALTNIHHMLKDGGKVILTVPAHQWLWNRDDAIAGHKRRYTKKELVQKLQLAGFEVEIARYFFIFILPLLWLRSMIHKDSLKVVTTEEYSNNIVINTFISKILYFVSSIENKLNNYLPNVVGGSLFVVAKKK